MSGFQTRIEQAKARERLLTGEMESRGWTVWSWEPIPQEAREELIRYHLKQALRWWPDMFAMKDGTAILIDAKGPLEPNATIEAHAAWTYESVHAFLCPVLIFWLSPDGWVGLEAGSLREWTDHDPRPGTGRGSGTPWYLIEADRLEPIDTLLATALMTPEERMAMVQDKIRLVLNPGSHAG